MTIAMDLPTSFLPNLPRQSLNTLDPLSPKVLSAQIARLRTLLVPGIHGVSTVVPKSKENLATSTSPHPPSHKRTTSNISAASTSSNSTTKTSTSTISASVSTEHAGLDDFETDWAEKWLHGLITRGEGWLAEVEPCDSELGSTSARTQEGEDEGCDGGEDNSEPEESEEMTDEQKEQWREYHEREAVLKDASALISSLAGCAAGGGITRDLVFPLDLSVPASFPSSTSHEPFSTSSSSSSTSDLAPPISSPTSTTSITLKIYDAALSDHTSVGVQTWGSAILLGRIFALNPWRWLFDHLSTPEKEVAAGFSRARGKDDKAVLGPRVLELGAGTGVMAILVRRILDEMQRSGSGIPIQGETEDGTRPEQGSIVRLVGDKVLATDYHPLVLDNLEKCIRLNFTAANEDKRAGVPGLETMLLDWSTFPGIVTQWAGESSPGSKGHEPERPNPVHPGDWTLPTSLVLPGELKPDAPPLTDQIKDVLDTTWDIIIAADCVYDLSHAEMIRDVVKWTLRLPEVDETGEVVRPGGVLHLLSPIRPTYAAETTSIIEAFPSMSILPNRAERLRLAQVDQEVPGDDDNDASMNGPISVTALSARLARFGSKQDVSSGRNTPTSMRHVPSTNNSSGQATPRLRTNRNEASSRNSSSTTVDIGGLTGSNSGPGGSALQGQIGNVDDSVLAKLEAEAIVQRTLAQDMGRGREGHWVLATTQRRELERMKGSGRSDEVEYWWWEIRWC